MSRKCFTTVVLYILFLALMLGTAYLFFYLNFTNWIGKVVIIALLMITATALALTVEKGSFITLSLNAILWGTALSFMFDHLDAPDPIYAVCVALVMTAWFTLFCIFTNFSFIKNGYGIAMTFWVVALVVADIVFAVYVKDVLGWMSLILLAPFIAIFAALPGEAENFFEHTHHIAVYSTVPALLIVGLILFFRNPVGSFETEDFFPEVDEDYIFTYTPKFDDDDEPKEQDLSDFM